MSNGDAACAAAATGSSTPIAAEATMPVAERFVSINGEGPNAGRLAAFIRFTGCNLACSYCDTTWANAPDCPHENLTIGELVRWVAQTGAACVTLTGGEPALQPQLPALVEALARSHAWGCGKRVIELETNGAVDLTELARLRARLASEGAGAAVVTGPTGPGPAASVTAIHPTAITFTLDCKSPSSGMARRMLASNYDLLEPHDSVKFVVGTHNDLLDAERVIATQGLIGRCQLFLSPVFGSMEPATIVSFMQEHRLAQVRLQLQLHKLIWPGTEKGV